MHGSSDRQKGRELTLIAAPFTAFGRDGELELRKVEEQARALLDDGLRGAFVCGTTGEGASLSTEERVKLARRWCEVAGNELEIIIHVGHTSLTEACVLAEQAEQAGADAIAAVAPFYYKPDDVRNLVDFCDAVAQAAPHTPFYYYHIPSMTHVHLRMAEFLAVAMDRMPTLAGIKFTHNDLMDYGKCLDVAGAEYEIFFGQDEILLASLSLGARSAVGSTYNFAAPLYDRMFRAFENGDMETAREYQAQVRSIVEVAERYGGLPAFKAMMCWVGVDCGPCRPPLKTLGPKEREPLRAELEHVGFFEAIAAVTKKGAP